ncbi:hypothetical protein EDC04DRAFT_2613386 [Pisolithus marmoratus]|nr:hypothetical protein EDC04DRAFT_2613386 [Pisolithus marmoratus]
MCTLGSLSVNQPFGPRTFQTPQTFDRPPRPSQTLLDPPDPPDSPRLSQTLQTPWYQVQAQSCLNKQHLASFQCHPHHKHSWENFKLKDAYLIAPPVGVMGLAALVCPTLSVSGILVPGFTEQLQERSMVSKSQLMDQKGYDGDVLQDDPEEAFYLPGPQPQERSNMEPKDNGYDEEFDDGVHGQQDRHINWDDDNDMQNDGLDLVVHPDGKPSWVHTTFNALPKWANVPPKSANTIPKPSNVPAKSGQQKAPHLLTKDVLFEHHQRNGVPRAPDPARLNAIHYLNTHITQSHFKNKGGYGSGSEGGDKEDKGKEDVMDYPCAYKMAMKLKFYLPMWKKVLHIACTYCHFVATVNRFPDCMDVVEDEFGAEILLQSIEEFKAKCCILDMSYYEKYAYEMKIWMYSDLGNLWSAVKKVAQSALMETFDIEPMNALMEEDAFAHVKSHYTQLHKNSRLFRNFHDDGTVENFRSMALTQTCVHAFYNGKMSLATAFPEKFGRILPGGTHVFGATMLALTLDEYADGYFQHKQVKSDNFETIYDELCDLFDKVEDSRHYDVLEAHCKQIAMLGWFLAGAACVCLCYMDAQPPPDNNEMTTMSSNTSPVLMGDPWLSPLDDDDDQYVTDTHYFQPAKMILSSHAVDLTSIDNDPWLSPLDDNDDDQYVGPWLSPLDDNDDELYMIDACYFQPAKMIVSAHAVDLTSIDGDPWLPPLDNGNDDYHHYHMTRTTATDDVPISTVQTVMITTNHYGTVMWSTCKY